MYGFDESASLEMKGMVEMVSQIKMQTAIGVEKIGHILDEELPIAKKLRAHLKKINFVNNFNSIINQSIEIKKTKK